MFLFSDSFKPPNLTFVLFINEIFYLLNCFSKKFNQYNYKLLLWMVSNKKNGSGSNGNGIRGSLICCFLADQLMGRLKR